MAVVDFSVHDGGTWLQPRTLEELLDLLREFNADEGGVKMVVGNTEVGKKEDESIAPRSGRRTRVSKNDCEGKEGRVRGRWRHRG